MASSESLRNDAELNKMVTQVVSEPPVVRMAIDPAAAAQAEDRLHPAGGFQEADAEEHNQTKKLEQSQVSVMRCSFCLSVKCDQEERLRLDET